MCRQLIFVFFLLSICAFAAAQNTYVMSNDSVNDCYADFTDSDDGTPGDNYDHNENYVFTICVANAVITMTFSDFCTEQCCDYIEFFDGPDTLSPPIGGQYAGNTIPPPIVASSGCLTIHFVSDGSVACYGWLAAWSVVTVPPVPPQFLPIAAPNCSTTNLIVNFDQPIPCDSIPGIFTLTGPSSPVIISAAAVNCVNDSATQAQLVLNPGLDVAGTYTIIYEYEFLDACDSLWVLSDTATFVVNNCPIIATINASSTSVCLDSCITIWATAVGGDPNFYTYAWSNGLPPTAGPHVVCPLVNTTYSVTVDDNTPATPGTDTQLITVIPPPVMPADMNVCQSAPALNLSANPPGGFWSGTGITNAFAGTFDPFVAGAGTFTITYAVNGCPNYMQITVTPVYAGPDEAACVGTTAFIVSGFTPPGGTWSGSNILPNGLFDPNTSGVYVVTYTVNGCTDTKTINVGLLSISPDDTSCTDVADFLLTFTPVGGTWSGTGIINPPTGLFSPFTAGNGLHTLTYSVNGCSDSLTMYVHTVTVAADMIVCPFNAPFTLPAPNPAGGIWSGIGITNPNTGMYDPNSMGGANYDDLVTYTYAGCDDQLWVYVRNTVIGVDTLFFCPTDPQMFLDFANTGNDPWNGAWTGTGVIDPDFPGTFDPAVAGTGTYTLNYLANGCQDSMVVVVFQNIVMTDTSVCLTAQPFNISATPIGGNFSGTGITNPSLGTFDATIAGVGAHIITYTSIDGCTGTCTVTVTALPVVSITNVPATYCYVDSDFVLIGNPAGGNFFVDGNPSATFNPLQSGTGNHTITYTYGTGDCAVTVSVNTTVTSPVNVVAAVTVSPICYGDNTDISANASGGDGSPFTYTWSNGLGTGQTKNVTPLTTTTYTITADDGCSEPATATITVIVHPQIIPVINTSPTLCDGDTGFATITINGPNTYSYLWNTNPPSTSNTINEPVGNSFDVTITDNATGCTIDTTILIDGYSAINAYFDLSPSDSCVNMISVEGNIGAAFQMIDLSSGATTGTWDFGDGSSQPYSLGSSVNHVYTDTGSYTILLHIENSGNCVSEYSLNICIEPYLFVAVPNAFTPNGDGLNDRFRAISLYLDEFEIMIFDRYGKKMYQSDNINDGWDGIYKTYYPQPVGVYAWVITYSWYNSPNREIMSGNVTLIR